LNLVQLLAAAVLHLMIGWVYLLFSPFGLSRQELPGRGARGAANPFSDESTPAHSANPFSGSK
jgi:hypothetical protein